jgi:hypothetical protein
MDVNPASFKTLSMTTLPAGLLLAKVSGYKPVSESAVPLAGQIWPTVSIAFIFH